MRQPRFPREAALLAGLVMGVIPQGTDPLDSSLCTRIGHLSTKLRDSLIQVPSGILKKTLNISMTVEEPVIELRSGAGTGSEGTTSPKVSSIGSGREGKRPVDLPQVVDAGAPGLDTHHWAGVRRGPRDGDTRSIASSMAAEKDALSVYDNQECEQGYGRSPGALSPAADSQRVLVAPFICDPPPGTADCR